ncbi:EM14S01-3B_G0046760.mRNA.1.CDS.1 [Saccharomyces cerevisiae]|nr:EM14S01-3B_G0046760.mRNA.1.CDS.1 [Saccharomyces cerevisiae]
MINLEDYWEDETPGPDREPTNELRNEVEETITLMELLKVSELKDICRSVSFPVSGRKAVLQDLIRNFLQNALVVGKSDPYRVQAVKFLIERIRKNEPLPVYKDLWNALRKGTPLSAITVRSMEGPPTVQEQSPSVIRQSPTQRRKTSTTSSTSRAPPPTNPDASSSSSSFAVPTIHFKESPFYKIQRLIPELVMNVEVTGGRDTLTEKGSSAPSRTLDPKSYNIVASETTTPVTNRVIPEYLGNSSSYIGKQLPNILGKTPLNVTAVDNLSHLISPDVSVSSPTPRNTASNASSSALSTPPLIRMSSLDPRGSTVPDKTIRPPINSNSYTASISDSFVQPQESSVFPPHEQNTDMSFPSAVNSRFNDPRLNTTRFPDSTLRGATILSNNGLDQRNNSLQTIEAITRNDVGRQNSTPVLPTLPQNVPIRTNSNKSGLPLINNENSVPNPPSTATIPLQKSRLIVNPFIPRRPYSNVLPQKRQLSNTSSTSPIMGTWKTQDYGKKYNSG